MMRVTERAVQMMARTGCLPSVRPQGTKKVLFRESDILTILRQTTGVSPNDA